MGARTKSESPLPREAKLLLLDIGNTNSHLGLAKADRVVRQTNIPTTAWSRRSISTLIEKFLRGERPYGICLCSVVPSTTPLIKRFFKKVWSLEPLELTSKTLRGVGMDYPRPTTVGADRLANAIAVRKRFGAPSVVVDFGTAVTFDVVNSAGNYAGGIIAPGLAAMTDYLHEKTALLPKITIRDIDSAIGKSTEDAMLIGAVHGYRGLIRQLLAELKAELRLNRLPVIATGGYARIIAAKLPEITAVDPNLTLEGLRLVWLAHQEPVASKPPLRQPRKRTASGRLNSRLSLDLGL